MDAMRPLLAAFLANGYVTHVIAIHSEPFPLTTEISERPRASNLARVLSVKQSRVPNLRHRLVELSPLARLVARLADGSRTIAQMSEAAGQNAPELWAEELASAGPEFDGKKLIARTLHELARSAILEA